MTSIRSEAELKFLRKLSKDSKFLAFGKRKEHNKEDKKAFRWEDSKPFTDFDRFEEWLWATGQPDNREEDEDCVWFDASKWLHDISCHKDEANVICKKKEKP